MRRMVGTCAVGIIVTALGLANPLGAQKGSSKPSDIPMHAYFT
jgi:hypothetical protein